MYPERPLGKEKGERSEGGGERYQLGVHFARWRLLTLQNVTCLREWPSQLCGRK